MFFIWYFVAFKPSFKKHPLESETYAAEHGNVTIKCNPEAAPKPQFVWKKDFNVIGNFVVKKLIFFIFKLYYFRLWWPQKDFGKR